MMDSIPENITFNSPHAKHRRVDEDDNSSIESAPTHARGKAFRSASGQKTTGLMEEEDDDDDDEEDSWGENLMDVDSYASEVENLCKQVEDLKGVVHGIYQTRSKDSGDTMPSSTAASTAKKAKTNHGSAASVADSKASRRSSTSRGSSREHLRKTNFNNNDQG